MAQNESCEGTIYLLEKPLSERDKATINKALDEAEQRGIKRVVDWIIERDKNAEMPLKYITPEEANESNTYPSGVLVAVPWEDWQAFLKDLGV